MCRPFRAWRIWDHQPRAGLCLPWAITFRAFSPYVWPILFLLICGLKPSPKSSPLRRGEGFLPGTFLEARVLRYLSSACGAGRFSRYSNGSRSASGRRRDLSRIYRGLSRSYGARPFARRVLQILPVLADLKLQ